MVKYIKTQVGWNMPFFEYKCPNCGKIFEELVKSYKDEVLCPSCTAVAQKNYSGTVYTETGKPVKKCSGDCKNCSGCG